MALIYNQGIEDRTATLTAMRSEEDVQSWFDATHPLVVVEEDDEIIAFGSTYAYSSRPCYAGIAKCSIYVRRDRRGLGAGAWRWRRCCGPPKPPVAETDLACVRREYQPQADPLPRFSRGWRS